MANVATLLGGPLKWAASLGGGTLTAIGVGLMVEVFHMDPTTMLGGGIAATIGTGAVKFCGWVTAKYAPAPTPSIKRG